MRGSAVGYPGRGATVARLALWTVPAIVALLAVLAVVVTQSTWLARRLERVLGATFDGTARVGAVDVRLAPTVTIEIVDLEIRHRGRVDVEPLVRAARVRLTASIVQLLRSSPRVAHAYVEGLDLRLPPKGDRPSVAGAVARGYEFVIERLDADRTTFAVLPGEPNKTPRVVDIQGVRLAGVGPHVAIPFEARLTNPKPIGDIWSEGRFGPWDAAAPRNTPVTGTYRFDHADLSTIAGIRGTLSSSGDYDGRLDSLNVHGHTDTPDFALSTAGNAVPLSTTFDAVVDGTSGDTVLERVDGRWLSTRFTARGRITREERTRGHRVQLEVTLPEARLRDVLTLALKGRPFMDGTLRLTTAFDLRPGEADTVRRLRLAGRFDMARARFLRPDVQRKVDELSRRAQGRPSASDSDDTLSAMTGRFEMTRGVVAFEELRFAVRGATVALAGHCDIADPRVALRGQLTMDASVSQTMTGAKSWLLKVVDPLFRRRGAGAVIPLSIAGTPEAPQVSVDVKRIFSRR
ncbi:MAG: hypothetical protein U0Q12_13740 [Vicinamibacterales bacterium]